MSKLIRAIDATKDMSFLNEIFARNQFEHEQVNEVVEEILCNVKSKKDEALREYTKKFDRVDIKNFLVSDKEIEEAVANIEPELYDSLVKAKNNIEIFHQEQLRDSFYLEENNKTVGQIVNPLDKVGIYVPGGTASYPSTVLMNAVPAKIAGVSEIVMVTPPNKEGKIKDSILVAAKLAGVDKIFKVGGAQAIMALTYGTESIPKVDKIVGPGNIYVAMAKKRVMGYVGIDMVAGPSEILIIADETANPKYIAADLISQAEHDVMAASILITDSEILSSQVNEELKIQVNKLERKEIIEQSLKNYGAIIKTDSLNKSIDIANDIAPEHLEIVTANSLEDSKKIKNAGAIFVGEYSPEPVGDYFAGPNHTLPTSSTARFSSALSVDDFIKKTSLIYYSKDALAEAKDSIIKIADNEGLTGHANAIKVRFEEEV